MNLKLNDSTGSVFWNIASNGVHLIRTEPMSIYDGRWKQVEAALVASFPLNMGYSVTRYECNDTMHSKEVTK